MSTGNIRSRRPSSNNGRILYDARGSRVRSSALTNKYLRFLFFYMIPYFVINGIILMLVCSTPRISVEVKDTDNYINTEVSFTVKSLLPLKSLSVSLESEPIEYEKSGSKYKCTVSKNGTFTVDAKSVNGMSQAVFSDISMLDDTAPSIDESSISLERGELTFGISDTQAGVNFDSIFAVINDSETIYPSGYDRSLGLVKFSLPKSTDSIELHFEDLVGNARSGRISVTVNEDSADITDIDTTDIDTTDISATDIDATDIGTSE